MVGKLTVDDLHCQSHSINHHSVVLSNSVDWVRFGWLLELLVDLIACGLQSIRISYGHGRRQLRWGSRLYLSNSLDGAWDRRHGEWLVRQIG